MRVLGYPPGWIEDVKQQSSGLDFIDNPNSSSSSEEDTVSYDVERIISYPGFNVPLKRGYRDVMQLLNISIFRFLISFVLGLSILELSTDATASFQGSIDPSAQKY